MIQYIKTELSIYTITKYCYNKCCFQCIMSPRLYPGQHKFRLINEVEVKRLKRKTTIQRLVTKFRDNKKQQQKSATLITEEVIAQHAIER